MYSAVVSNARVTTLYGVGLTELYYLTPLPEYDRLVDAAYAAENALNVAKGR